MKRLILSASMLAIMTSMAAAGTLDDVIAALQSDGFKITEVSKTLLGNYKVEATNGNIERQVVYSPFFDRVLRDKTDDADEDHSGRTSTGFLSSDDRSDDSAEDHESGDRDSGGHEGSEHESADSGGGEHESPEHESGGDG